ncbi:MAG: lactonase family protein [Thermoleophilaceae bacterium]
MSATNVRVAAPAAAVSFVVVALLVAGPVAGAGASAVPGSLTQLPSPNSCLRDPTSSYTCPRTVDGLNSAMTAAISPDGKNLYVTSEVGGTIAEFSRNPDDGTITPLPSPNSCIKDVKSPAGTNCPTTTSGLRQVIGITISRDGRFVYTGSGDAIDTFARDPSTGALSRISDPAGCIRNTSTSLTNCSTVANIDYARWITLSPDGNNAYVSEPAAHAIGAFSRNPVTGVLTQLPGGDGCIEDVNDNSSLPLTDGNNKSECTLTANGLDYPRQIVISPDGLNAYTASDFEMAISEFSRDPVTGALRPLPGADNCIKDATASASYTRCTQTLPSLNWVYALDVSPDGKNVYAGGEGGLITSFTRDPANGALRILPGDTGCVKEYDYSGGAPCAIGNGLDGTSSILVSPDGLNVYGGGFQARAISEFARDPSTGALTQLPGADACIKDDKAGLDRTHCSSTGQGIVMPRYMAISPDGEYFYSPTSAGSAIALFKRTVIKNDKPVPPPPPAAPPPPPPPLASVTKLRIAPRRFFPAQRGATMSRRRSKAKTGTKITYLDSQAATTTLFVQRVRHGVRKGRSCVKPLRGHSRAARRKRRCTRYVAMGAFAHHDRAGANRVRFSGRLKKRKLAPGRYRLTAVPRFIGRLGTRAATTFTVVAKR